MKTKQEEILTFLIECTWLEGVTHHGWGCGYIAVPSSHPWFNKTDTELEITIHGGVTWAASHLPQYQPNGLWYIGFDTMHGGDTKENCPKSYCEEQVLSLKQQAINAIT